MINLDSIFKSRDITLPTKVRVVKPMVFPVVMYGCESWTVKKAEHWRINAFELWCWRRLLRVPWTARRSNQSILKEISPGISLEGMMLKLKVQYFGHLMRRVDSLEKTLMLGGIGGRRRRGTEDEMAGWHHWLNGCESQWTPGVGDGQGGLACCDSWGLKESDTTERLIWSDLIWFPFILVHWFLKCWFFFTLTNSWLTTSNLPWFMDLTFQVPVQYCVLQHWTLLSPPDTSPTGLHFYFGSAPSFFLEPFYHSATVACWSPMDLGQGWTHLPASYLFAFSYCSCVHGILKAGMMKCFSIPFFSGPHFAKVSTITHPSW